MFLPLSPLHSKQAFILNYVIIIGLAIVIGLLIGNSILTNRSKTNERSSAPAPTPVPAAENKSIAVLAFANMSQEKDQEYFSDGISEEILNLLTKVASLKVISRTSSFSYKEKNVTIKEIGKQLHVTHLLEGSIRKSGDTFRITAQLIDAKTGIHIWSETYDRYMEDIFKIQDEIATKVTQQLKISLLGKTLTTKTADTEAYNMYLQASQLSHQFSSQSTTNAFTLIKRSLAIDSTYAPAWVLLGNLNHFAGFRFASMPLEDAIDQGKAAATKAISLDPEYIGGYLNLAKWENMSWNFKEANDLISKAALLDPNNSRIISTSADFDIITGKPELAIELTLKTIDIDPLDKNNYFNLGLYYWMNEEFIKAAESTNHYLLLQPNSGMANGLMARIQLSLGHPEAALEYIEKHTDPFWNTYIKNLIVYAMGNKQEADSLLTQFVADWGDVAWPNIAHVYAFRGEKDEAFRWLNMAYKNKDASVLETLSYPKMKNLWGDPRWNKLIGKLDLPDDHGFHLDK